MCLRLVLGKLAMADHHDIDRTVVSPGLLQTVDFNKPLDPVFDLGMSEWMQPKTESKITTTKRTKDQDNKENDSLETLCKKKSRPSINLKKNSGHFSNTVNSEQLWEAAKGVILTNTKMSNEWALRNVHSWMENRNMLVPNDPVPGDLLSCADASVLCK